MCGIFCFAGEGLSPELLADGIRRLAYRGYDSWGLALQSESGALLIQRSEGGIPKTLPAGLPEDSYLTGIAHTRWATHGKPSKENAHPHSDCTHTIAVVHNGIIENYQEIKRRLTSLGHVFTSETDSEVIAHFVEELMKDGLDVRTAFLETLKGIEGTYGCALISQSSPGCILAGRMGSPVVLGLGDGYNIIASDPSAIVSHTKQVLYLDDGECAEVGPDSVKTFRLDDTPTDKKIEKITFAPESIERAGFDHFMQKEIYEQPRSIMDAMRGRIIEGEGTSLFGGVDASLFASAKRIKILGCGTSWHAGLVGKYLFEQFAGIPSEVCYAAEFRYSEPVIEPDTLIIAISQSGETADTLAGVREAKRLGADTIGIVNVVGSSIARECGRGVFLHAGPEIGVASTKAFTSQLVVLSLLAIQAGRVRGRMTKKEGNRYLDALQHLGEQVAEVLSGEQLIASIAAEYSAFSNVLYVGRLYEYPLALEGALKLKEISYLHAEGIPAAELKHGPIALIDKNMPVVVLAAQETILDKMISNVHEIKTRGGRIIAVVRQDSNALDGLAEHTIPIPKTVDPFVPILGAIPLQLLAYHIAVRKGCNVDRPRNLAKSVTVE